MGESGSWVASGDSNKERPDHFAFYTCQIKTLVSQNDFTVNICGEREVVHCEPSLFSNSIAAGLSDHKEQTLNSLLRQSLAILTPEADAMLESVIGMRQLQSQVTSRKTGVTSESETGLNKSSSSTSFSKPDGAVSSESCQEEDSDLQLLLAADNSLAWEMIKKHSDELFTTLSYMEKQLEEQLDTVVSTCRPMTLAEKKHLQKLIQQLPPKNLNRVARIVQRSKPEAQSCNEVFVDLEQEDNTTLWRLYYYIEAVEKAKKLVVA
ncbi:uncharacterized protein LOC126673798 [Mercurialis annua]|uniref:uncharacterized protein LOC126673798 n=1 Tax=Mercurialis annua TaxID=3986 RepID=UPI00215FA8FC|nr:uncharacterized protein LOC126673798 [Mercurialis annua]XP_050224029.1 uncharacterized protein LOC126673798 [Mercurialis annua]XP_050224030.1 uncharacterized protein LOC126673798 [Mercurialis annua]